MQLNIILKYCRTYTKAYSGDFKKSICSPKLSGARLRFTPNTLVRDFTIISLTSQSGSECGNALTAVAYCCRQFPARSCMSPSSVSVKMLKSVILIGGPQKGNSFPWRVFKVINVCLKQGQAANANRLAEVVFITDVSQRVPRTRSKILPIQLLYPNITTSCKLQSNLSTDFFWKTPQNFSLPSTTDALMSFPLSKRDSYLQKSILDYLFYLKKNSKV